MDKEFEKILKNLNADILNFRKLIDKYHAEINKKGKADKAAQIEYHCTSLKIAVSNFRGR